MKIVYSLPLYLVLCCCSIALLAQETPTYLMQNIVVTDCAGILFDSGGPDAPYSNNEELTFTICPTEPTTCLRLFVDSAVIENAFDFISFYDGPEVHPRDFLGSFSGELPPFIDAFSGCLSIHFTSDNSTTEKGWAFHWVCSSDGCPGIPVSPQDCVGAIPICQDQYFETNAYQGTGFFPEEINGETSCLLTGERNDVWYVFTVQESGQLNFTITPNDLADDYDWAVFNLTEHECPDIFQVPELEVGCDFSATLGPTGPNGLEGMQNEPEIPVLAGETYVINVSQFSSSTAGYTIDFSASSAVIFDNVPPSLTTAAAPNCGENGLNIRFSENILCGSVTADDFQLIGPNGQSYGLINRTEICLTDAAAYENRYQLQTDQALTIAGVYTLTLVGDIADICGNTSTANNMPLMFTVTSPPFEGSINDVIVCEAEEAIIQGDTALTYQFYTSAGVEPSNLLSTGSSLVVTDQVAINEPTSFLVTQFIDGCESEAIRVTVTRLSTDIAAFELPDVVCLLPNISNPIAQLAPDANGNGFFSINNGGVIDSLSGEIDLSQMVAGTYTVTYTTIGNCPNSSSQTITLVPDFSIAIATNNFNCLPDSDQFELSLSIIGEASDATYQIIINELEQDIRTNTPTSFLLVGNGQDYVITVVEPISNCSKTLTINSPICMNMDTCQANAGQLVIESPLPTTMELPIYVCFEEILEVTATNAIVPEGMILTYVVHDGSEEVIGDIIAFDSNGTFNTISNPIPYNESNRYYIASVVGIDLDNDGLPELNDSCTVQSIGVSVTFLPPIIVSVNQICNRATESYDLYVSIAGGLPSIDPLASYQVLGSTNQQLNGGDILVFSLPFSEAGNPYELIISDDIGCTQEVFDLLLSCTTLPIELLSFTGTATPTGNQLSWTTASEYHNAYFQIEHSTNGIDFEPITTMLSLGNSTTTQTYSFLHPSMESGLHYYQLTQTDIGGQTTDVGTISIARAITPVSLQLFPNPTTDWVYFNWSDTENRATQFKLYDLSGKLMAIVPFSTAPTQGISLSVYPTGIYFIVWTTAKGEVIREKIIKQ